MRKIFIVSFLIVLFVIPAIVLADKDEKVFMLEDTYSINQDGKLTMYTNDAEVTITGSDRKDVHVDVYHVIYTKGVFWKKEVEPFDMEVIEEDGNLIIRELDSNTNYITFAGSIHEEYTIDIQIPRTIDLKLRGDDDKYIIKSIDGDLSLRVEDGNARISDCNSENLEFEIEDGDVQLTGGKGTLCVFIEDGDFTCLDGDFHSIEATAEDGEIEVSSSVYDDGFYRFDAEDGWIEFNVVKGGGEFYATFEDGNSRASSDFKVIEDDEDRKVYKLDGGKAKVRLRVDDGKIKLTH